MPAGVVLKGDYAFADEVIALLDGQLSSGEIIIESVKPFRFAEREGKTAELIASMLPK